MLTDFCSFDVLSSPRFDYDQIFLRLDPKVAAPQAFPCSVSDGMAAIELA